MKKKLLFLPFFLLILAFSLTNKAESQVNPDFNGDALYYNNSVYLVATNSGTADLYRVDNNKISLLTSVKAVAESENCRGFIDGVLNIETGGLFMFLTDGRYIYKYDINEPGQPRLIKRANDGAGNVFLGLGKMDNKVYSVAEQGIKIWNDDMLVFFNASLTNAIPHNIKFSKKGSFIFNINNDNLEIYDAYSQRLISSIGITANGNHERNIFNDEVNGTVYLVDDQAVKQLNFSGEIANSFKHISNLGYDIAYTPGDDHLFFSDGVGVVKLNKTDLKPLSWAYAKSFGGDNAWATGLKVVRDNYGEKLFIFTGGSIVVLNQDFKKVGIISVGSQANTCLAQENVFLSVNQNSASVGQEIFVSGRGFDPGEQVPLYLADWKISSIKSDNFGKFNQPILVPQAKIGITYIRAAGESSNKTYETIFEIKAPANPTTSQPILLNKSSAGAGEEVSITGVGYWPKEYVLIFLDLNKIAVAQVDGAGNFSTAIKIPVVQPGVKQLEVRGNDSAISRLLNFTVN